MVSSTGQKSQGGGGGGGSRSAPKELTAINLHLNNHPDVPSYAPAVAQQLAELAHRHVHDLLQDSLLYAEHAGRTEPDLASVRLAAQARQRHTWVEPNPAEFTADLAREVNSRPLPKIEDRIGGGVRLPPESDCLTGRSLVLIPDEEKIKEKADEEARRKATRDDAMEVEKKMSSMLSSSSTGSSM